jgi:hypothetical protein
VTIGDDWVARLGPPRSLRFAGADEARDLPGHVRAGSGLRRWGERLVVVQDDVNALALLDERAGTVTPLVLPAGAGGRRHFSERRGNKAAKMDLEACVVLPDGRLLAIGSGSTPAREHLVVVDADHHVRVVDAAPHRGFQDEAMIICAAGDIHGALDQLYEDVLAFEESLGVRFGLRAGAS